MVGDELGTIWLGSLPKPDFGGRAPYVEGFAVMGALWGTFLPVLGIGAALYLMLVGSQLALARASRAAGWGLRRLAFVGLCAHAIYTTPAWGWIRGFGGVGTRALQVRVPLPQWVLSMGGGILIMAASLAALAITGAHDSVRSRVAADRALRG